MWYYPQKKGEATTIPTLKWCCWIRFCLGAEVGKTCGWNPASKLFMGPVALPPKAMKGASETMSLGLTIQMVFYVVTISHMFLNILHMCLHWLLRIETLMIRSDINSEVKQWFDRAQVSQWFDFDNKYPAMHMHFLLLTRQGQSWPTVSYVSKCIVSESQKVYRSNHCNCANFAMESEVAEEKTDKLNAVFRNGTHAHYSQWPELLTLAVATISTTPQLALSFIAQYGQNAQDESTFAEQLWQNLTATCSIFLEALFTCCMTGVKISSTVCLWRFAVGTS